MKASELVKVLQDKIKEHGDLEVKCYSRAEQSETLEVVNTWLVADVKNPDKGIAHSFEVFSGEDANELFNEG